MIKDDVLNGMCVAFESQSYCAFRLEVHFLPLEMAELCNNLKFRKNCELLDYEMRLFVEIEKIFKILIIFNEIS